MLKMIKHILIVSFLTSLLLVSEGISAQTRINSPYSRYGIGDISMTKNARYMSMGGITYGIRDKTSTNFSNPASYVAADTVCFVFEGSVMSRISNLATSNSETQSNYTSLGYLAAQFPVTKWMSASFGLLPYSNVGYEITDLQTVENIGNVEYVYEGSSGFNRFYIGTAVEPFKGFSVGVNASYNFGSINNYRSSRIVDSLNSLNYFNVRISNSSIIHDVSFDFGLQYHKEFKNDYFLGLGAVYGMESNLNTDDNYLVERYTDGTSGYIFIEDTIEMIEIKDGKLVLPMKFGSGFSFGKKDRWLIGADYTWQNWSKFSYLGQLDTNMTDSWQISLGGEFIPKHSSVSSYFSRINYRLGFRYGETYLTLQEQQLGDYGISFGFGLPLRGTASMLNIGFEIGQRGSLDHNLIKESYGRITFAFNIFEGWFYKRKYN